MGDAGRPDRAETILIVDDDPVTIRLLGVMLKEAGYEVLALHAAEKVIPTITAKRPDLVLLDVSMPETDGYTICGRILAEPGQERLPVIFLTGKSDPEDVVRGFEAGAVDYLIKPVNRIELLGRLRNHLDRRSFERSLSDEKERFRILTENVGEAYILASAHFSRVLYVNPSFKRIFGFTPPSLPASMRMFEPIFGAEELRAVRARIRRLVAGEEAFNQELRIKRPDGSVRWVWARVSPIVERGQGGYVVVVEDITDRKLAQERLEEARAAEAQTAGLIQRSLLMNEEELVLPGLESAFVSIPSKDIDGDFFYVYQFDDAADVIVGDVMGKGLHAALIGAGAKTRFLQAYARLGMSCGGGRLPEPGDILEHVNHGLADKLISLNSFFTAFYLRFMPSMAYLEYIDCGHMPLIVWDGEACWSYKGLNTPIGILQDQVFETCRIPLRTGNLAVVFSDGITEAMAPDGELFGEERFLDTIRRNGGLSPADFVEQVEVDVGRHLQGGASSDDITLAAFRIGAETPIGEPRRERLLELPADLGGLGTIREAVKELLSVYSRRELGDEGRDLAVLAANEAASNVIHHGLGNSRTEKFSLRLEAREGWYSMTFRYRGEPFDWARERNPSALAMDESGYGIFIIKKAMHSLVVAKSDTGLIEIVLAGTTI